MKVICIIPCRMASERFPGKPLAQYQDRTLLEHAIMNARGLDFVDKIVVATPDTDIRIKAICDNYQVERMVQTTDYSCGTERLLGVQDKYPDYDYYMTMPIDEPAVDPEEINKVLKEEEILSITTFFCDFYNKDDVLSKNSCKMIISKLRDTVMYTSRAIIPSSKSFSRRLFQDLTPYKKHVGVFIFPRVVLNVYGPRLWDDDNCAEYESLEQNKFIFTGMRAFKINHKGKGIDSEDDIEELEERFK